MAGIVSTWRTDPRQRDPFDVAATEREEELQRTRDLARRTRREQGLPEVSTRGWR